MQKTEYHVLTKFVPRERINPEVIAKLDLVVRVAEEARPVT
jgi:hypothetical protein